MAARSDSEGFALTPPEFNQVWHVVEYRDIESIIACFRDISTQIGPTYIIAQGQPVMLSSLLSQKRIISTDK